jgi:hypothetical protein
MARVAIFVLIPVVALLSWRDWVVERQLRGLAYDEAYRDERARVQIAARDEVIDDAMWQLLLGDGERAVARVKDAARMPAPTGMPERSWRIAAAAGCAQRDPSAQRQYAGWRDDARVREFCVRVGALAR